MARDPARIWNTYPLEAAIAEALTRDTPSLGAVRQLLDQRRLDNARLGAFKPLADFDWQWPKRIERGLLDELLTLAFLDDATNVVLLARAQAGNVLVGVPPAPAAVVAPEGKAKKPKKNG